MEKIERDGDGTYVTMTQPRRVYLNGTITGEGHRVECKVEATEKTAEGDVSYSDYRIIENPETARLSDGNYEVEVSGQQFWLRRTNGRFHN